MKIAVFVSGPIRYVDLVEKNLELALEGNEYEIFYHLWKEDLGNKKREGYHADYISLAKNPKTKVFIIQNPYSVEDFANSPVGTKTNSDSSINATMGMFLAVSILCNTLKQLPDFESYTHILRMRTDALFLKRRFIEKLNLKKNEVAVSRSPYLPVDWICDHMFFSSVDDFLSVWSFNNMSEIYKYFIKGNRIPEKTLARMIKERLPKNKLLKQNIFWHKDYEIVYSPPKEYTPKWVRDLVEKRRFKEIFLEFERYYDDSDISKKWENADSNQQKFSVYNNKIITFFYEIIKKHPSVYSFFKKCYRKIKPVKI